MDTRVWTMLLAKPDTLTARLEYLHKVLSERMPDVSRIACAIYDSKRDLLKTFINSTQSGEGLHGYEYHLADSPSLKRLVSERRVRVIDHMQEDILPGTTHSDWLIQQGYQSSFTVPMFHGDRFLGFIFFDSLEPAVFDIRKQRDLEVYSNLITMTISSEMSSVRALIATVKAARDFAHLRDFETGLHLDRMAYYSRLIARHVADVYRLNDEIVELIYLFAPLHDIGKIGVPDNILLKPGRLTDEERAIIQTHVNKGVHILKQVLDDYELSDMRDSKVMLNIVAYHHEFLDGSGYPNKLKKDQIPIEARVITVADIFDALTSRRPYKKPWSVPDAIDELERMASLNKVDSNCIAALRANTDELGRIVVELADRDESDVST